MCGGGSSFNPVKQVKSVVDHAKERAEDAKQFVQAPRKRIKKTFKSVDLEKTAESLGSDPGSLMVNDMMEDAGFRGTNVYTNPTGQINKAALRKYHLQPKAEAAAAEKLNRETDAANQATIRRINQQKDRQERSEKASSSLRSRRGRQDRLRAQKGRKNRQSTILTNSIGAVGGQAAENRKTLIGG